MNMVIRYAAAYLGQYLRNTRGVAAMEYAIIAGVIVVGVGTAVALLQDQITGMITAVTTDLGTTKAAIATNQDVAPE